MDALSTLGQIGHLLAALAAGYGVIAVYRWIANRSRVLAAILAVGILARVTLGLGLFWISYLGLPIAESLQSGGGFWELAVDARRYYNLAAAAVDTRSFTFDMLTTSPFYIWVLSLWMFTVGVSPAAAMFLNLCLYVALAAAAVRVFHPVNEWRRDLPCIVFLGAYSFLPIILIHSTQPLKDEVFNALLATACLSVLALRRVWRRPVAPGFQWSVAGGAVALAVATFGASGIRWYYGFMIWCGVAGVLALFAFWKRTTPLSRYLAISVVVLATSWAGFWAGSGRYYYMAVQLLHPVQLFNVTQLARVGFLRSGGNTNIVVPLRDNPDAGRDRYQELLRAQRSFAGAQEMAAAQQAYINKKLAERSESEPQELAGAQQPYIDKKPAERLGSGPQQPSPPAVTPPRAPRAPAAAPVELAPAPPGPEAQAMPITTAEQVTAVTRGLAVVFVPISLLRAVSNVDVEGGRGLLSVVDLDTIFLDVASIMVLGLLWVRRHTIGDRLPLVIFGLVLAAASSVLLGYVVTNLGTLWRLRSLIAVPLWIVALALSSRADETA